MTKSAIVIPARLQSTRLPEKMLLAETGRPLIQHTYESASRCEAADEVWVATDHERIAEAVTRFGGRHLMTSPQCQSGTDRIAEVAAQRTDIDIFVNVQGDEPEISSDAISLVIRLLEDDPQAVMATVATPLRDLAALEDPGCVKVVINVRGDAMYFSRSPIPYPRSDVQAGLAAEPPVYHAHVGLYAYRRDFLLEFPRLAPSATERMESLEQLRVLENGYRIKVGVVQQSAPGIDTIEDYRAFVSRMQSC